MHEYIYVCVFNENKWIYLFSLKLVFINILLYIEIYTFLKIFMSYRLLSKSVSHKHVFYCVNNPESFDF